MAKLELSKRVNAPRDRVFEVFTDLSRAAERIGGIKRLEILTDGPVGKGTRFRETREMFGREATETMEITDFQPGRSYTLSANSCGALFTSTLEFMPQGSSTEVVMRVNSTPQTLMAWLMWPLGFLFAGAMKKVMQGDLDDLAHVAEAGE